MHLVNWRDRARTAAERFREQYANYRPEHTFADGSTVKQYQALLDSVDPNTAEQAEYAIVALWVEIHCDECNAVCESAVHIGDDPDYEARWQILCIRCLQEAVSLLVDNGTK